MFANTQSFFSDLSRWNTKNVEDKTQMLFEAKYVSEIILCAPKFRIAVY